MKMTKKIDQIEKLEKELADQGIDSSDLMSSSRRNFLVKSLRSSATTAAMYKLGLISLFIQMFRQKSESQIIPFGFMNQASTGFWAWGINSRGELGDGTTTAKSAPVQIPGGTWIIAKPGGDGFRDGHSLGIKSDNTLWAWGANAQGQLGVGSTVDKSSPSQIAGTWTTISAGVYHSAAIRSTGTLWTWGDGYNGCLGNSSTLDKSSPVQVTGGGSWIQVATGAAITAGIKTDNTLWTWGSNFLGALGLGDETNRSSPTQVAGSWIEISLSVAVGYSSYPSSLGIKSDNTLWAWGLNQFGQLGNNTTDSDPHNSPIQIAGSWAQVSCGSLHNTAIKSDGTLWAWGENGSGQLGNGNTSDRSSPIQIAGSWIQVNAGVESTWAQRSDETWWGWGKLAAFNGTVFVNSSSPVQLPGTWTMISARDHALAIR